MSQETVTLTIEAARELAEAALTASGCTPANARAQARAVIDAERDGITSHGFLYLPIYCEHARGGKVKGDAAPRMERLSPSAWRCDADTGFAFPAIDVAFETLIPAARENAIAAVAIVNSYNCGVLGQHVARLAEAGLVGIGGTNSPATIAPVGGRRAVIGTNPIACAIPDGQGGAALVIDQSASVVAKSEIIKRAREGRSIPEGWAYGPDGETTTDAALALKGTVAPSGGYKGFSIGLIVEILAAAVSGATLGIEATSFVTNDGGPPRTGQFFLAIEPERFSAGRFADNAAKLLAAISEQPGARLPGTRRRDNRARAAAEGISLPKDLYEKALSYREMA